MAVRLMMSVAPLMLGIILIHSRVDAQSKLFVDPDRQACEQSEILKTATEINQWYFSNILKHEGTNQGGFGS